MNERKQFKDKQLQCVDCGNTFAFTTNEQFFFWSKGLTTPKRCLACRRRRKITIVSESKGGVTRG